MAPPSTAPFALTPCPSTPKEKPFASMHNRIDSVEKRSAEELRLLRSENVTLRRDIAALGQRLVKLELAHDEHVLTHAAP